MLLQCRLSVLPVYIYENDLNRQYLSSRSLLKRPQYRIARQATIFILLYRKDLLRIVSPFLGQNILIASVKSRKRMSGEKLEIDYFS